MKYLDRHNGLWEYRHADGSHPWKLLAKSYQHIAEDFAIGSQQNHASVKHLGPFVNISTNGTVFQFPPEFECGDSVWMDTDWLYNNAVDYMQDYIGSPERIGGLVKQQSSDGDYVTVTVDINVPVTMVTKK